MATVKPRMNPVSFVKTAESYVKTTESFVKPMDSYEVYRLGHHLGSTFTETASVLPRW